MLSQGPQWLALVASRAYLTLYRQSSSTLYIHSPLCSSVIFFQTFRKVDSSLSAWQEHVVDSAAVCLHISRSSDMEARESRGKALTFLLHIFHQPLPWNIPLTVQSTAILSRNDARTSRDSCRRPKSRQAERVVRQLLDGKSEVQ